MSAKKGDAVAVHYTGRLEDGSIFDSSVSRSPLSFTLGDGNMIKGFDSAVYGMVIGDKKGKVGVGIGKAGDTQLAIEKAVRDAKKNMLVVPMDAEGRIPHDVHVKYASSEVMIMPAMPVTKITEQMMRMLRKASDELRDEVVILLFSRERFVFNSLGLIG